MDYFRNIDKRILLTLGILLSVMLLCGQGINLHTHNLDHEHENHHNHSHTMGENSDHGHLSNSHLSNDKSHNDHHDNVISEIEISPEGALISTNKNMYAVFIFALFLVTAIFITTRRYFHHQYNVNFNYYNYYLLSPPLRAPPQH